MLFRSLRTGGASASSAGPFAGRDVVCHRGVRARPGVARNAATRASTGASACPVERGPRSSDGSARQESSPKLAISESRGAGDPTDDRGFRRHRLRQRFSFVLSRDHLDASARDPYRQLRLCLRSSLRATSHSSSIWSRSAPIGEAPRWRPTSGSLRRDHHSSFSAIS